MPLSLHVLARASKPRAIQAALRNGACAESLEFLREHVDELTLEQVATSVQRYRGLDSELPTPIAFVHRLAELLAETREPIAMLVTLSHLEPIAPATEAGLGAEEWRELVTLTRGRLPERWWWWLVDRTRGCVLYNVLIQVPRMPGVLEPGNLPSGLRDFEHMCEGALPPLVIGVLDAPNDEAAVRDHALSCPMEVVVALHAAGHIETDVMVGLAEKRAESSPPDDHWPTPLPECLARAARVRASRCNYESGIRLTRWLDERDPASDDFDLMKLGYGHYLAALAFERDPQVLKWVHENGAHWAKRFGDHLTTGTAWKTLGRELLELAIEANRGFPQLVLRAALAAAQGALGTSVDERRAAILSRAHDAAGGLFIEKAAAASATADWQMAERFLAALSELECGSFVVIRLHKLRKQGSAEGPLPESVEAWIDACVAIAKSSGRKPTESGLVDAFNVLMVAR